MANRIAVVEPVYYIDPPEKCDTCPTEFKRKEGETFYDAKTCIGGRWGNICPDCFQKYGYGLGTGIGQKYRYDASQKQFVKIGG